MHIKDSHSMELDSSIYAATDTVGIVIKDRDETGKNTLGLYIPRFMMGIDIKEAEGKPYEKSVSFSSSKIKNSINKNIGQGNCMIQNYLEVPCFLLPNVDMPRFVHGERVMVTFADQDIKSPTFFPFSVQDTKKRRDDIVAFRIPSKPTDTEEITDDNSYYLELNSKEQYVKLHTANANEENNPFTFLVNAKEGIIKLEDDSGRSFEWNYNEDYQLFTTDGGISFKMMDTKVTCECEDFELLANTSIHMKTSKWNVEADEGTFEITTHKTKTTSLETEGSTYKHKYPQTQYEGTLFQGKFPTVLWDTPAYSVTGVVLMAGFAMGPSPAAAPAPPLSPGGKANGPTSMCDMKGGGAGRPLSYADTTNSMIAAVAAIADQALGTAMFHIHPGAYKPLAPNPAVPSVPGPPAMAMKVATPMVSSMQAMAIATNFKA
jgi:hypothetical protein